MVDYAGNAIPAAGISRGTNIPDDEILYSTVGFTQKGVTLAAGQGRLLAGTVLARETSTKTYKKYVSGGSGGLQTPVGVLRKTVETGADVDGQKYMGNIVISGILKLKAVSSANGGVVSGITTGLGATTNDVLGTFKF
jgi:hypothetical protein